MKVWKFWAGLVLLLIGAAAVLPAEGLYVLGGLGGKTVYDQDASDFYDVGGWGANAVGLGDAALSVGWRFPGFVAVEGEIAGDTGREATADVVTSQVPLGYQSDFQVQPMTTFSVGPVFYFEHPSWWWWAGEDEISEIGLKLEYAGISGSETASDGASGSQDFSDSSLGVGVFLRDMNVWNPSGFSLGFEVGWDSNYFSQLTLSNTSGIFGGNNGQNLQQYGGGDAYVDNSGGYVRIVLGWSQPSKRPPVRRRPRNWRMRYYNDGYDYQDNGGAGDGAPGSTIPTVPQAQPAPQAAPQQNYPANQNYGN